MEVREGEEAEGMRVLSVWMMVNSGEAHNYVPNLLRREEHYGDHGGVRGVGTEVRAAIFL